MTCPDGNGEDWVWTMFALIQEVGDYYLHACSSFTDPHFGESVIVAGGNKFFISKSALQMGLCANGSETTVWI